MTASVRPSVLLTFLAPADRCNQRCPACIIDLANEPVRDFTLGPRDFAQIVDGLVENGVPIRSISFQGYEVTLRASWPYVEAVFAAANAHGIDKGFITNGMLLHKWSERIRELDPSRITVSLDGSDALTNDAIRGLDGALEATTESVRRFLAAVPTFQDRVAVASTLFLTENYHSLLEMPALLGSLGVSRWVLSAGVSMEGGRKCPTAGPEALADAFEALIDAGKHRGIRVHVNDEFGRFERLGAKRPSGFRALRRPDRIVRVEPAGYVRVGDELLERFDAEHGRRYDPGTDDFLDVIGYRQWTDDEETPRGTGCAFQNHRSR